MADGIRGTIAATVKGDVPTKFWPDTNEPLLYQRSICLAAGPSGVGKSLITVKLAADLTRTAGKVIYCNAEDDPVIQAFRLSASGADMAKVRLGDFVIPDDLDALELAIRYDAAKLVVFDTAEKHINAPIQRWAKPLMQLGHVLKATDCSAMFVHHTNKNVKKNADWRAAIGGATAGLIGTARSIALVGKRPDDAAQIVFCPVKDSYDETPRALAFEFATEEFDQSDGRSVEVSYMRLAEKGLAITNPVSLVHVAGDGDGDGKHGPSPEKAAEAAEFITETLADGCRPVKDVYRCKANPDSTSTPNDPSRKCGHASIKTFEAAGECCPGCGGEMVGVIGLESMAEAASISFHTVKKAKVAISVPSGVKGFGATRINYWRLPDGHPSLNPNAPEVLT
jgi:AAA domain